MARQTMPHHAYLLPAHVQLNKRGILKTPNIPTDLSNFVVDSGGYFAVTKNAGKYPFSIEEYAS